MRKGTREAVAAWNEAETKAASIYKTCGREARDAILAAGGWVTSSPSDKGFCHVFEINGDRLWPDSGVCRTGERNGGVGPHADKVAPHCHEVGDLVLKLETEHRKAIFATHAARAKVYDLYADIIEKVVDNGSAVAAEILTTLVRTMIEAEETS